MNSAAQYRYECIRRTRIAQHEVVSRVLRRKVSDGKWFDKRGLVPLDKAAKMRAVDFLQGQRAKLHWPEVLADEGSEAFLTHFADMEVGYDEHKKCHFLIF